jgi:hypothetical protein
MNQASLPRPQRFRLRRPIDTPLIEASTTVVPCIRQEVTAAAGTIR